MKLWIINGPNVNFIGIRETDVYGNTNYHALMQQLFNCLNEHKIDSLVYQSNNEGYIIDKLQEAYVSHVDGIIINPGALTHYSYAIRDAIASIGIPVVEVHFSNILEREAFRAVSVVKDVCIGSFMGKGIDSYKEGIRFLINHIEQLKN